MKTNEAADLNIDSGHQQIMEFERQLLAEKKTAKEFIHDAQFPIDQSIQLELIGVELEHLMNHGKLPVYSNYLENFPYLETELVNLFSESIGQFVLEHCPLGYAAKNSANDHDRFQVVAEIGRGRNGVVYRALDRKEKRHVAIKALFFNWDNLSREAAALERLAHPNICQYIMMDSLGGIPILVMELADGYRLDEFMEIRGRAVSLEESVSIVAEVATALAHAHEKGITHLDIKPANIISNGKQTKLIDFFVCESFVPEPAFLISSPSYIAPERYLDHDINPKLCDVYGLGVVLFELLTGRKAFQGNVQHVIDQIKNDPPRRPTDYRKDIPPRLERVCLQAIAKNPEKRFQSVANFRDALLALTI